VYHLKPDGTIMLPAGKRQPDLSIDELTGAARARLADITRPSATRRSGCETPPGS
jgi:hypothetical protein